MIFVEQKMIRALSFCDAPVLKMELNSEKRELKIDIGFAFIINKENTLFENRISRELDEGILVFKNWSDLIILRYNQQGIDPVKLENSEFEQLEDIQIFEEKDNSVQISSFGVDIGHWMDWVITGAEYHGEFKELNI